MKHHHYNKVWSYLAALVLCLTLIQPPPTMAAGTNEVTMRVGEQRTIYAPITSASVSDGNWSSNDPQKVRILSFSSFQCEVKALTATGSSFVNLNYRYRTSTSSPYQNMDVRVTVKPPLPTGVTLTPGSMTLAVGESRSLSASVTPEGADYGSYLYSSEDPSVAEVGSDGSVYGAAPGTTRVQVRTYLEGKRGQHHRRQRGALRGPARPPAGGPCLRRLVHRRRGRHGGPLHRHRGALRGPDALRPLDPKSRRAGGGDGLDGGQSVHGRPLGPGRRAGRLRGGLCRLVQRGEDGGSRPGEAAGHDGHGGPGPGGGVEAVLPGRGRRAGLRDRDAAPGTADVR